VLSPRYRQDGQAVIPLSAVQEAARDRVNQSLRDGTYQLVHTSCALCQEVDFELLAEKDRYGIDSPVCICRRCGLIQAQPRMKEENYLHFYEHEYRKLHTGFEHPPETFFEAQRAWWGHLAVRHIRRTMPHILNRERALVIEVGCGAGGILQAFRESGCEVVGCDLDPRYVDYGRTEHALDLRVGRLQDLKLERLADLVLYHDVLEHILDPIGELRHAKTVLAADGVVSVRIPSVKNLAVFYQMDFLRLLHNAHIYYPSLQTLEGLGRAAGYSVVSGTEETRLLLAPADTPALAAATVACGTDDYGSVMTYLRRAEHLHMNPAIRGLCTAMHSLWLLSGRFRIRIARRLR